MKTNKNKRNIVLLVILSMIIIAGIIVIAKLGFNRSLYYSDNVKIKINLGQDYDINDIKNISNEVFGSNYKIQKVELFNEQIAITIKDVSDEQMQEIKNKVSEKYQITDIDSAVTKMEYSKVSILDITKNYIMPGYVILIVCIIYLMIRYYKVGIFKVLYIILKNTILGQALYFSIIAISRIPVDVLLMPISALILIISIIISIYELKNKKEKIIMNVENNENK